MKRSMSVFILVSLVVMLATTAVPKAAAETAVPRMVVFEGFYSPT